MHVRREGRPRLLAKVASKLPTHLLHSCLWRRPPRVWQPLRWLQVSATHRAAPPRNRLKMIIRAHEVTMDGFDLHSDGHLVTLFSATNYCGVCGNNGAVIEATWGDAHSSGGWTNDRSTLVLQAKLISSHVGENAQQTWVMGRQAAPPTPPRDRPGNTTPDRS